MENKTDLNITPETKIGSLLENYPQLEDVLIGLAPVFTKLRNPVLRRTIAKVTSIRQAAAVGSIALGEMITKLRNAAGLEPEAETIENKEWKNNQMNENQLAAPAATYDARKDLEAGIHPVARVMSELNNLNEGERFLLITPFTPAPLIDKAKQKGFDAVTYTVSTDRVETFFSKAELKN